MSSRRPPRDILCIAINIRIFDNAIEENNKLVSILDAYMNGEVA
jgi:uncharacterized protein (DUF1810 family)